MREASLGGTGAAAEGGELSPADSESTGALSSPLDSLEELEERFASRKTKRSSLTLQTKHQLRDDANRWKQQYDQEISRSAQLTRRLTDQEQETIKVREELREARARIQESHRERQRLEKDVQGLRNRKPAATDSAIAPDMPSPSAESAAPQCGLREFRLGRVPAKASRPPTPTTEGVPAYSKRSSSLGAQTAIPAAEDDRPAAEDALLVELANAKTAEAVARQELEEVKAKLDSLRRILSGGSASPGALSSAGIGTQSPVSSGPGITVLKSPPGSAKTAPVTTPSSGGGFFSGWGKRSFSVAAGHGA
jgi:hypothetical protein